nr:RNA-directed DNA polymerase, eukaryota, reverse transcriptase zinc-binding domain protein [Tanacetum cinerariifolium]
MDTGDIQSNDINKVKKAGDECLQNIQDETVISKVGKICHVSNLKGDKEDKEESICSGHFKKVKAPHSGGSMLQLMEDLVKVGQIMGYNMKGCLKIWKRSLEYAEVLRRVGGGNTLTILSPSEEEQAELKDCSLK